MVKSNGLFYKECLLADRACCAEDRSLFRFEKRSPAGIGWTWIMVVPKKSMDSNIQLLQEIKLVINKLFDGSQDITDKLTRVDAMPPANL